MAAECDQPEQKELRLLLVGRSGCGKSSTGNTILGMKHFETSIFSRSATSTTTFAENFRLGRKVVVVDTPGYFDTERTNEAIRREIVKIFGYLQQGFHALIYIMGVGRFTEECIRTKELFFQTFGEAVAKYTVIVITHYDVLKEENVGRREYLAQSAKDYADFQAVCGKRIVFLSNKGSEREKDRHIKQLFGVIDGIGKSNIRKCFSNIHMKIVRAYCRIEEKKSVVRVDRAKRELRRRAQQTLRRERSEHWAHVRHMPVTAEMSLLRTQRSQRKPHIPKIKPIKLSHPSKRYKFQEQSLELFSKLPPIASRKEENQTGVKDVCGIVEKVNVVEEMYERTGNESDGESEEQIVVEAEVEEILRDLQNGPEEFGSEECPVSPLPEACSENESDKRNMVNNQSFFEKFSRFIINLFDHT